MRSQPETKVPRESAAVAARGRRAASVTPSGLIGAFVTVVRSGDEDTQGLAKARLGADGIGRFVGLSRDGGLRAVVEYFVSPAGPKFIQKTVEIERVRRVFLYPQTSVFWQDEATETWRRGRVTASDGEGVSAKQESYRVRFPNDVEDLLPGAKLHVRWAHPVEDPVEYLAARVSDTPYFFEGRQSVVSWVAQQRAAFGGLTGLASASIDLLKHQVAVVRRVLADPVQRYLLADEVGLGKTIEACTVVRQHLIDNPREAKVVIVAPDHLSPQWAAELWLRFGIPESNPRVRVVPESAVIAGTLQRQAPTMLVVDEAHRSAAGAFAESDREFGVLYANLNSLAAASPRVLLLSGTPVLRQEDGFLAMLHLLDPKAYPLDDREGFRDRIQNRSTVADALAQLADDAGATFVEDAVGQLTAAFRGDPQLIKLTGRVAALAEADEADPARVGAIRALRLHVTETYKLHRRLLRTRRDDPSVSGLLAVRKGLERLACEDPARRMAWDLVEEWRGALPLDEDGRAPGDAVAVFADLVEASLSHPVVLAQFVRARGEGLAGREDPRGKTVKSAFDGEQAWCRRAVAALQGALRSEPRADLLAEWLANNKSKAIIFVDTPQVSGVVAERLRNRLGPAKVLQAGGPGEATNTLPGAAERFVEEAGVQVLVCDRRAEEGLNLQGVRAALVHYDLPFAPTRVEQRSGRVDRLAARGSPRFVAFESMSPYEEGWVAFLEERVRVFHRTVAPLQYLLADSCQRMREHLVSEGAHAFGVESARLAGPGGLEDELRLIRNQEALDSFGIETEEDATFHAQMCEADEAASDADGAELEEWLCKRIQFSRTGIAHGERDPDFHYTYVVAGRVLLPLPTVITALEESLDRTSSEARYLRFGRFTYDREEAVGENGVRLLRPGNPFLDAVERLVRHDDRGAAFALWRHDPSLPEGEAHLFFRTDFIVEADVGPATELVRKAGGAAEALRHMADAALPPISRTVWVDVDGRPVTSESVLARLELGYETPRDTNLRPDRWPVADAIYPVHDWRGLCEKARAASVAALWDDATTRTRNGAVRRFEEKAESHRLQWQSRIARIPHGPARAFEEQAADRASALDERLARGLKEPLVRIDSVGVVYLSGTQLRGA